MAPMATRRTVLAGGTMLLAGTAAAQQPTTLKVYSPGYEAETTALAFEVPRRTAGRHRIEPVVGFDMLEAALGKERAADGEEALLAGAQRGDLDLVITASAAVGNYVPEVRVLDVPFLFRDAAHARAVLDGPIGQGLLAEFPQHGLVGLAWTENGVRHVTNDKRPIRTPEDLKGLRLRTQQNPIIVEAFRTLGVEVTPMPWGRAVLDALARGAIDGQENPISVIQRWDLVRVQKYLSLTGHIYSAAVITMAKAAHDRLSEADRQGFVESARYGAELSRKDIDDHEDAVLAALLGGGMAINADVDKAVFRAALAPAYATWRERFGDLVDRVQAYQ